MAIDDQTRANLGLDTAAQAVVRSLDANIGRLRFQVMNNLDECFAGTNVDQRDLDRWVKAHVMKTVTSLERLRADVLRLREVKHGSS